MPTGLYVEALLVDGALREQVVELA